MIRSLLLLTLALAAGGAFAADANSQEAKLRESLRATLLQMRTLQAERDTLQAAKDQAEADKKTLEDKLAALTKQSAADQASAAKTIEDLRARLGVRDDENLSLHKALDESKAAHQQAAALADAKEAARAKLVLEKIELQRRINDQQAKNREMYKLGTEVLSRYEKFGLGTAITAREPFVGITRVKLENLVQDYGDKLAEQRIKPEASTAAKPGAPAKPDASAPAKPKP